MVYCTWYHVPMQLLVVLILLFRCINFKMYDLFIVSEGIIKQIKIKDGLSSYEIDCAVPQGAPSSPHFELDLQPAVDVV